MVFYIYKINLTSIKINFYLAIISHFFRIIIIYNIHKINLKQKLNSIKRSACTPIFQDFYLGAFQIKGAFVKENLIKNA